MAIPVFTNYTYKHTKYRGSTGVINDITVSGGDTTVEWRDSNGNLIDTFEGSGPYSVTDLRKGTYEGTVTNLDGSATTTVVIEDKGRLYLSVDETTTETDCQGQLIISAFQHNDLGLEYELTNLETSAIQTYSGGSGEAHIFTGLCNGAYRLIATETQEYEYDMGGGQTLVPSTDSFIHETYLTTLNGNSGSCESLSQFIGEDVFDTVGSTTNSFLEFYTGDNSPIDGLFEISNVIIKAPKESPNDDSGVADCDRASLKINIKRNDEVDTNTCDYVAFNLDGNGKILFTHSDGSQDYNITQECCSSLGYIPELSEFGVYHCRWKEVTTDPCQAYIVTENVNNEGHIIFVDGNTGEYTNILPTAECCLNEGLVATQIEGGFSCSTPTQEPTPVCEDYIFSGSFATSTNPEERYAIFLYDGGQTNSVPSTECCDANDLTPYNNNGNIRCYESVPNCDGYTIVRADIDGYILFRNADGQIVDEVYNSECCSNNGFTPEAVDDSNTLFKCKEVEVGRDLPILEYVDRNTDGNDCEVLNMRIIGEPDSWVKFRVTLLDTADNGFLNTLINTQTGESITPVIPAGSVGSYCEGSIYVDSSGITELEMTTCVRPPLRNFINACVELKFSIFDYDNKTIKPNNHQYNRVCWSN